MPSAYALSHEGKYLAFLNVQNREPETFIADLTRKTVEKLDTKAHTLIPIEFSSNANNLIVCTRTDKKGDKAFYGVFNVKNGEFKQLKEPVTMSGKLLWGTFYLLGLIGDKDEKSGNAYILHFYVDKRLRLLLYGAL